jgi:hypothetical protein
MQATPTGRASGRWRGIRAQPRGIATAAALAAAVALTGSTSAHAQRTVRASGSGAERIAQGIIELGVDGLWIMTLSKEGEDAELVTHTTVVAGLSARYFVRANIALTLTGDGFCRSGPADASDTGALVLVGASGYLRLGEGMFFAPGLAGGLLVGSRTTPTGPDTTRQDGLLGGAIRVDLPFVFYAWERFNLRGGLGFVVSLGTVGAEELATDFLAVDGGVDVGFGYYF